MRKHQKEFQKKTMKTKKDKKKLNEFDWIKVR